MPDTRTLEGQLVQHLQDYDVPEVAVLTRMKAIMIKDHGYEPEDFDGMCFTDIESEFLDTCGEPDFR